MPMPVPDNDFQLLLRKHCTCNGRKKMNCAHEKCTYKVIKNILAKCASNGRKLPTDTWNEHVSRVSSGHSICSADILQLKVVYFRDKDQLNVLNAHICLTTTSKVLLTDYYQQFEKRTVLRIAHTLFVFKKNLLNLSAVCIYATYVPFKYESSNSYLRLLEFLRRSLVIQKH